MYENDADRWAHDDAPLGFGEAGAGMLIDPDLCDHGYYTAECPNQGCPNNR